MAKTTISKAALKSLISTSTTPHTQIIDLTPDLAEECLLANTHNRPIRERHVEKLTGAIQRGEWKFNGDSIRFDKHGTLLDGQHRLWAVVMSGATVRVVLAVGLEPEVQLTIDGDNEKRRLSDHLALMGYASASNLAAIINMKWKLDNGEVRSNVRPTVQQALQVLKQHPTLTDSIKVAGQWNRRLYGSQAAVGALYYEFSSRDPEAAQTFYEGIIDAVDLKRNSPMFVMRRYVETERPATTLLMALMIKAWNAYIDGREMTNLYWRPVGKNAEPFPEIKG